MYILITPRKIKIPCKLIKHHQIRLLRKKLFTNKINNIVNSKGLIDLIRFKEMQTKKVIYKEVTQKIWVSNFRLKIISSTTIKIVIL